MNEVPLRFFCIAEHGDIAVLTLNLNQLSEEENLDELDSEWSTVVDKCHLRKLVLDMNAVQFMTSAAMAKFIGWHRRMVRNEGQMVLCSLQSEVESALDTASLTSYFRIAPNVDEACKFFID
jgi:anti-anti-sigma factor